MADDRGGHICLTTDFIGPCPQCEADKAEYYAQCAQSLAEQAQEEQDIWEYRNEQEPH